MAKSVHLVVVFFSPLKELKNENLEGMLLSVAMLVCKYAGEHPYIILHVCFFHKSIQNIFQRSADSILPSINLYLTLTVITVICRFRSTFSVAPFHCAVMYFFLVCSD